MNKKYIIGVCGTHGTGKSTIMNGLKDRSYAVNSAQLSRAAQKALGWDSLSRAEESVDNMWLLQDAILDAMQKRDQQIIESEQLTFAERTPADVWAYTSLWIKKHKISLVSDRANSYKKRCHELAENYAHYILVRPDSKIPFQEDPHRADITSRILIDEYIYNFIFDNQYPLHEMISVGRDARTAEASTVYIMNKFRQGLK